MVFTEEVGSMISPEEVSAMYSSIMKMGNKDSLLYKHIDIIDNIIVSVIIEFNKKYHVLFFKITVNGVITKLKYDDYDDSSLFTSTNIIFEDKALGITNNDVRALLINLEDLSEQLKFNKRRGEFLLYRRNCYRPSTTNGQDCPVCYEITLTKTNCNHYLCVECFQKIQKRVCPMCNNPDTVLYK